MDVVPCLPTSTRTATSVLRWTRSERDLESGLHSAQGSARQQIAGVSFCREPRWRATRVLASCV